MRGIIKATMVTFVVFVLFATGFTAIADKPAYTGLKCPPAVDGQTGSVTGRVTSSATGTASMAGAYVAVVNASNVSQEYFNTTSDASGYYQITGINASYNDTNASDVGPNGPTPYRIYASNSKYGEGWSAAFGIDAFGGPSSPGTSLSPVAVAPTPVPTAVSSPVPTPTLAPVSTPSLAPTQAPTTVPTTASATARAAASPATPYIFSLLSLLFAAIGILSGRKKN